MKAQFPEETQMANNHIKSVQLHQKSGKVKLKWDTICAHHNGKNLKVWQYHVWKWYGVTKRIS